MKKQKYKKFIGRIIFISSVVFVLSFGIIIYNWISANSWPIFIVSGIIVAGFMLFGYLSFSKLKKKILKKFS